MSDLARVELPNGIALDVWDSGPRDAPALIFLHGFPENHRTWRYQVEHLNTRFRCIAPDQRGYGDSSRPEGAEHYEAQALVGDVFGLAQALGVERFTVIGHDWGGALAWGVAAFGQASGVVERAVIANAPHPAVFQRLLFEDMSQREASQYMRAFRDPANDALVREHGLAPLLMKAVDWTGKVENDPAEQKLLIEQWADPDRAFAMLNWYRASGIAVPPMQEPVGLPPSYAEPAFPKIAIPTLVVWGMGDEALLPANVDRLGDWVEDLTVERVEGAGHFIPWEAPDKVNAALDGFLKA
ncbi:alpha/beta fold hydrolase [Aurantiacibacter aquimixticola]|uniref:Alpha/beta hydrolase n=1 Tax=Aurantiacibacter aquimixticola TaxID=1958945 RepID=A0A419RQX0_9SPHN|nr:alpha/beta hydrolase [Aurantiacibacter aquimixticola]RJY08179.1 alpha/beta hydrolase [Aurantiacibacter aquimixticola]